MDKAAFDALFVDAKPMVFSLFYNGYLAYMSLKTCSVPVGRITLLPQVKSR